MSQLSAQPGKASNVFALLLLMATMLQARRISSRRLVIHVPVKMKTHHHTHTVYKVLHGSGSSGGGVKQTIYKLVGFSGEGGSGMGHGGHSQSHGYGGGHGHGQSHSHGMGGMGEITYEDRHGCESGKVMPSSMGHRDMVFNHYARHDQEEAESSDYAEERDEFIDVRDAWL
ncbi:GH15512 [Drosophila grimshawi]|uniref:GH15512 n=1 Tax=Drosophila grimshawi TaxID=7222 RepID=B4J1Y4_DROGR|nr:GH15512 [Drosophila grimshawi]